MPNHNTTCRDFARILGGTIMGSDNTSCVVMRMREIEATVLGRPTVSPLTLAAMFSFEAPDAQGRTLNLGETVILPREVNPFIDVLRANGIVVTALHNHWLFERPRLMYIHFQSVDLPLAFADSVAQAFAALNGRVENETEE